MPGFRIIGFVLIVCLAFWIVADVTHLIGYHSPPAVLGLGNAFEGNLQLPFESIKAGLDHSRQRMLEVNDWGGRLRLAGDIASWFSFAATAAITIIIGFLGRPPAAGDGPPNVEGLSAGRARTIGLLAALAAVLTAFSNLSIAKSQDYFKRADEIRDLIVHARAQVIDAKTADEAQAVLDDLSLKSSR